MTFLLKLKAINLKWASGHHFYHVRESLRIREMWRNAEPGGEVNQSPDHSFEHMNPNVSQQVSPLDLSFVLLGIYFSIINEPQTLQLTWQTFMMSHCCCESGMQEWTRWVVWLWISHMFQTRCQLSRTSSEGVTRAGGSFPRSSLTHVLLARVAHRLLSGDPSSSSQGFLHRAGSVSSRRDSFPWHEQILEREQGGSYNVLYDLSSGVIYRHSCCYLFVTKTNPAAIWEGTIQWLKYQGVGLAGANTQLYKHMHSLSFLILSYFVLGFCHWQPK